MGLFVFVFHGAPTKCVDFFFEILSEVRRHSPKWPKRGGETYGPPTAAPIRVAPCNDKRATLVTTVVVVVREVCL